MTCVIPSQMAYSFIISNASRSMHCSSVEAYLLWKCCCSFCYNLCSMFSTYVYIFVAKCDAQSKAWDILLVLTSVAGNLCNKCPSGYSNKTAVKVILSMWSLVSIKQQSPSRPCDILVANVGPEVAKTAKTVQMCQKMCKAQNVQKQYFQGLANKVPVKECARVLCVCQTVVPASPRPVQVQRSCPAFPSLLQLIPTRSGPRSLAQLPRGPGRVPIIQGAFQRSYRAQEPWQYPGMCPGGAHGHIHLQPIGTVPRLKNYIFTVSENTWKNSKLNILFLLFDI